MDDIEKRRKDRWNFLFIAGMWFQDLFNYDFRRTEQCIIPYATQEGEISFCAYNTGVGWRNIIEKMHMTATLSKWYEEKGRHEIFAGGKKVGLTEAPTTRWCCATMMCIATARPIWTKRASPRRRAKRRPASATSLLKQKAGRREDGEAVPRARPRRKADPGWLRSAGKPARHRACSRPKRPKRAKKSAASATNFYCPGPGHFFKIKLAWPYRSCA